MPDKGPPDQPSAVQPARRPRPTVLLDVAAPHPIRSMFVTSWPVIFSVLLAGYLFALLFPPVAALMLFAVPLAVGGALLVAGNAARKIRLTVTDQQVRVANSKAAIACDRSHVVTAVLVESLARRWLEPRTTDLILLDRTGRCALLLSGRLWPPAVLEQVLGLIEPEIARVTGKQTPASLAAQFPNILQNMDGTASGAARSQTRRLYAVVAVALVCFFLIYLLLFR
ncbi:MAG: hypothetical protein ABWZ98_16465 [Nakamurella sp.]